MQPLDAAEKAGASWAQSVGASGIAELRQIPAEKLLGCEPAPTRGVLADNGRLGDS